MMFYTVQGIYYKIFALMSTHKHEFFLTKKKKGGVPSYVVWIGKLRVTEVPVFSSLTTFTVPLMDSTIL